MELPGGRVLDAFGLRGGLIPLPGGEGRSVRVGDAVLKPVGEDPEFAQWSADVMDSLVEDGFRVARPMRTLDGFWSCAGWTASAYVDGVEPQADSARRWVEIITAGRAFHRAIAHVPYPSLLSRRTDPWAIGNRVAWREVEIEIVPELAAAYSHLASLITETPAGQAQLVHGDLSGNVLFAENQPPAIIDFSPCWRPVGFADAIVVADAMVWHGAEPDLLDDVAPDGTFEFAGLVVRALIFRLVVTSEFTKDTTSSHRDAAFVAEVASYERTARWLDGVVGTNLCQ